MAALRPETRRRRPVLVSGNVAFSRTAAARRTAQPSRLVVVLPPDFRDDRRLERNAVPNKVRVLSDQRPCPLFGLLPAAAALDCAMHDPRHAAIAQASVRESACQDVYT